MILLSGAGSGLGVLDAFDLVAQHGRFLILLADDGLLELVLQVGQVVWRLGFGSPYRHIGIDGGVLGGNRLNFAVGPGNRAAGEDQAARVALDPVPITQDELPDGVQPTGEGWLRTDPGMLSDQGGMDGFFIARWRAPD
mgnify:CR=1 FL=1